MSLTEYRHKRNFNVTREPRGGRVGRRGILTFTIQKHAASHLHYDFRLELDGVLKSWAIPKGPSLDPATKRLAMAVEDHPIEYGEFEGIIPQGEYGGGTVMLWDRGTWEPAGDPREGVKNGSLKFILHGEKLHGGWMLVRKGGRRGGSDEHHWFLFKERDQFAKPTFDVVAKKPLSVTTGRDLDEIASQASRIWGRDGEISQNGRVHKKAAVKKTTRSAQDVDGHKRRKTAKRKAAPRGEKVASNSRETEIKRLLKDAGAKRGPKMRSPSVELATLVKSAPGGDDWMHEIKFDGYRMLARIERGKPRLVSRNGKDWTVKFPSLIDPLSELSVANAILDGEVVVMQPDGTTSFQALQKAFQTHRPAFLYYLFDVLYLNGYDTRPLPIEVRKELLRVLVPREENNVLKFSDHVIGNGEKVFAEAARLHLEGIISKRMGSPYVGARGTDWLKVKCSLREEFVIGGFTRSKGSRNGFGALALGYFDGTHKLRYAGRVGTGFDEKTLVLLHQKLLKLVQSKSPFADLSGTTGQARDVTWVKPGLVAQIEFSQWTDGRQLRHPSFQGLREDKKASEVVREDPIAATAIELEGNSRMATKNTRRSNSDEKRIEPARADGSVEVAGVRLSHPDKVLYPKAGFTKLDLANYYEQVADWMLPHVKNRLLSLVRCPAGSGQKCFFQKHPGEGAPDSLRRFPVEEKEKLEEYLTVDNLAGLISLVQIGVLEIHLWGSQADQFEKPDRLIFDLDPDPAVDWPQVVTAAKEVRLLLENLGLTSFVKTTGGKGLHIVVPVTRRLGWPETKAFCRSVADFMVAAAPDKYIATMSKAARKGKIFVDYLRNDRGATSVAPYSTRAKPGAPVSVPISWDELSPKITSDYFNIENLATRIAKLKKDPWATMSKTKQSITAAMVRRLAIR